MDKFEEVVKLKKLLSRKSAIKERQKDTAYINHGIMEAAYVDHKIINAVPWLLDIVDNFKKGDADEIACVIDILMSSGKYMGDFKTLHRILRAACIMEEGIGAETNRTNQNCHNTKKQPKSVYKT